MKFVVIFLLVSGIVVVSSSDAAVLSKRLCTDICPARYAPVCAGDKIARPLTFDNSCKLELYNCVNKTRLRKIKDGECPGGDGVVKRT